ncbi:MAG: formyltransferase family protein [Enterobacteriaceae bacterium]
MKYLNIIFAGNSNFSLANLKILIKRKYIIKLIVTKNKKIYLKEKNEKINKIKFITFNEDKIIKEIKKKSINLIIIVDFATIIPKSILNIVKFGCINIHCSLLPKCRGPSPIQCTIINEYKYFGFTIIKINEKIDEGDIIFRKKYLMKKKYNSLNIYNKLIKSVPNFLSKIINKIKNNKIKYIKQNNNKATYSKKIKKSESKINWNSKAKNIIKKIKAFSLYPTSFFFSNKKRIKVWNAKIKKNNKKNKIKFIPGEIINIKKYLFVATKDDIICFDKVQIESRKKMEIKDIQNSNKKIFKIGHILK